MVERKLVELERFIKHELHDLLQKDLHRGALIKEADVECACYFHIRRYLGDSKVWRVVARKYIQKTGYYVDLVIFRKATPKIAIELKWGELNIQAKDEHSLQSALTVLGVNKAYWITVIPRVPKKSALTVKPRISHVLHYIAVSVDPDAVDYPVWRANKKKFLQEMKHGKGTKKESA